MRLQPAVVHPAGVYTTRLLVAFGAGVGVDDIADRADDGARAGHRIPCGRRVIGRVLVRLYQYAARDWTRRTREHLSTRERPRSADDAAVDGDVFAHGRGRLRGRLRRQHDGQRCRVGIREHQQAGPEIARSTVGRLDAPNRAVASPTRTHERADRGTLCTDVAPTTADAGARCTLQQALVVVPEDTRRRLGRQCLSCRRRSRDNDALATRRPGRDRRDRPRAGRPRSRTGGVRGSRARRPTPRRRLPRPRRNRPPTRQDTAEGTNATDAPLSRRSLPGNGSEPGFGRDIGRVLCEIRVFHSPKAFWGPLGLGIRPNCAFRRQMGLPERLDQGKPLSNPLESA